MPYEIEIKYKPDQEVWIIHHNLPFKTHVVRVSVDNDGQLWYHLKNHFGPSQSKHQTTKRLAKHVHESKNALVMHLHFEELMPH